MKGKYFEGHNREIYKHLKKDTSKLSLNNHNSAPGEISRQYGHENCEINFLQVNKTEGDFVTC